MRGLLRVNGPGTRFTGLRMSSDNAPKGAYDAYFARLVKLIPTEVIAFYLVGYGLIPPDRHGALLAWTILGVIAVVVVRSFATQDDDGKAQWSAVAVSAVSFLIWLYSLGHVFDVYGIHVPFVGSLLVLAWTFFLPYIYRGS